MAEEGGPEHGDGAAPEVGLVDEEAEDGVAVEFSEGIGGEEEAESGADGEALKGGVEGVSGGEDGGAEEAEGEGGEFDMEPGGKDAELGGFVEAGHAVDAGDGAGNEAEEPCVADFGDADAFDAAGGGFGDFSEEGEQGEEDGDLEEGLGGEDGGEAEGSGVGEVGRVVAEKIEEGGGGFEEEDDAEEVEKAEEDAGGPAPPGFGAAGEPAGEAVDVEGEGFHVFPFAAFAVGGGAFEESLVAELAEKGGKVFRGHADVECVLELLLDMAVGGAGGEEAANEGFLGGDFEDGVVKGVV